MSRYKAYAEYRDSGVEWLGDVPKDWSVSRVKFIGVLNPLKSEVRSMPQDTEVSFLPMEVIGEKGELDASRVKLLGEVINGYTYIRENDVFFAKITPCFENGKGAVATGLRNYIAFATTEVIPLRCNEKTDSKFLYYLFSSAPFKNLAEGSMYGAGGQKRVPEEFVADYQFASPCPKERLQISDFLDHETGKIDTLIAKQQELIKLLKEKRQAVISHAVTKGLDPNAPMRDSGVDWLGEVPVDWGVLCIKHIVAVPVTDGPHETPEFLDCGVPFISAEAVSTGIIDFDKIRAHISEKDHLRFSQKYKPEKHDIYMVKSGATTGVTAINETNFIFNIWSPLAVIRCNKESLPHFVLYFLRSENFKQAVELNWSFGTQQNIGMGVIENLHMTKPPILEAKKISEFLIEKCQVFEEALGRSNRQVSLLIERRTALISAAVTGKIDVRDWRAVV